MLVVRGLFDCSVIAHGTRPQRSCRRRRRNDDHRPQCHFRLPFPFHDALQRPPLFSSIPLQEPLVPSLVPHGFFDVHCGFASRDDEEGQGDDKESEKEDDAEDGEGVACGDVD